MEFYAKRSDGTSVELTDIKGIRDDTKVILIMSKTLLGQEDVEIAHDIELATGKRCIILPPWLFEVVGV